MKPFIPYDDVLKGVLKDPMFSARYLNSVLEEGDWDLFLLALRNVAMVHGGVGKLAKRSKLHRVHLYRMLSKKGNPSMRNIMDILRALGFGMAIQAPRKLDRAA
jgi:probable addiction module antidote protein